MLQDRISDARRVAPKGRQAPPASWRQARAGAFAALSLALSSCTPLIASYSLDAYKNATSLKAETLALIGESGEQYSAHEAEVKALTVKLSAAYEFANGIPKNEISAGQWKLLTASDGNLYGGFVRTWQKDGKTSKAYQDGKAGQIGRAFDFIACLEVNKKEAKACSAIKPGDDAP